MMNDRLKIKISIADRVYPLQILPEQEEGLRKAAKKIDEIIKQYEQNYAVRDKQDVLAMCALQFATEIEQNKLQKEAGSSQLHHQIEELNDLISKHLN